ncbi:hypothetical protein CsSME_00019401 [Camellia sinensis var. sinensis]
MASSPTPKLCTSSKDSSCTTETSSETQASLRPLIHLWSSQTLVSEQPTLLSKLGKKPYSPIPKTSQPIGSDLVFATPPEFLLSGAGQLIDLHRCRHRSQPRRHRRVPPGGARTPHRSRIVSHQLESILRHRPSQVQELEASLRARSQQQQVRPKIPSGVSKIAESEVLRSSFQRVRRQCPHSGVHFSRIDYSLVRLLV